MTFLHSLVALGVILAFSVNILAVKIAVGESSPAFFAVMRFAVVALLLLPFFRIRRPGRDTVIASLFMCLHFVLLFISLSLSQGVGPVVIGLQLLVPFAALLGAVFRGEYLSFSAVLGIVVAFGGVVSLGFDPIVFEHIDALLVVFAAACAQACATLFMRRLGGLHPLHLQLWIALLGLPLIALASAAVGGRMEFVPSTTPAFVIALLVAVTCGSIAGHGGLFYLVQRYPLVLSTSLTMAVPFFATTMSAIFLDEIITPRIIMGGLITIAGVSLIQFGKYLKKPDPSQ